jgi:foldase protein PrsA
MLSASALVAVIIAACGGPDAAAPAASTDATTAAGPAPAALSPTDAPPTPVISQPTIDAMTTQSAVEATAAAVSSMGTPNARAGDPAAAPIGPDGQPAAAVVNEAIISRTEYDRAYERFQMQMGASNPDDLRALVLNMLIEQALIEQAAAGQNIAVSDAVIDAEVRRARELAGSDEAWAAWLAQNLYTESEFRETLRDALLTGLMRDAVTQDLNGLWLQARARHILVASADEAQALIERLRAGADFAALASQYSLDITTRQNGGELGWFLPGELLEPALDRAAFQDDIGLIGTPIQSSLGYHVFEVLGREQRPVEEDRRALLAQSRFEAWLDNLTAAARIQIFV